MAQRCPRQRALNVFAFAGDRRGSFATMSAIIAPLAMALTAFAVDEGALYTEKRNLQSLTDIAAITAAANLANATNAAVLTVQDNKTTDITISAPGDTYDPKTNSTGRVNVIVERGRYTKSTAVVANRFQPNVLPYNSVRVTLRKGGDLYFARPFMDTPLIETTAVAHVPAAAAFSIGSRLASLNGGILNETLGKVLGTNLSLSAMSYESLVNLDVNALDFLGALKTQLNLQAGTYDDVLNTNATVGQIAGALASISGSNQTAQLALQALGASTSNVSIPLKHLISLGSVGQLGIGEKPTGLSVDTNVMGLISAAAAVAGGKNQVSTELNVGLPGVVSMTTSLAIGEPPQNSPYFAVGEVGTIVRTAQTRLYTRANIGGATFDVSGGLLGLVVGNIPAITLPLYAELAYGEAKLTDISCPTGKPDSIIVKIDAKPGVADLYIGTIDTTQLKTFTGKLPVSPAVLASVGLKLGILNVGLLEVIGTAHVAITNNSFTNLTFNKAAIDAKQVMTVSTRNTTESLTTSLVDDLELTVTVLNTTLLSGLLNTVLGTVKTVVKNSITQQVVSSLDTLLYNTLSALGVKVGEAHIRVTGATCGRSVLVQ